MPENGFDFLEMETRPSTLANYMGCFLSFLSCLYLTDQVDPNKLGYMQDLTAF